MKTSIYKNTFLKIETENNVWLCWFPNHYAYSNCIEKEYLEKLKKTDKSLLICEDKKGRAFQIEVNGFENGLSWQDNKTDMLKNIIIDNLLNKIL